jgi:hypothetical protein
VKAWLGPLLPPGARAPRVDREPARDPGRKQKQRWKDIGRGRFVFGEDTGSMADLFKGLETDYENNRRRSDARPCARSTARA